MYALSWCINLQSTCFTITWSRVHLCVFWHVTQTLTFLVLQKPRQNYIISECYFANFSDVCKWDTTAELQIREVLNCSKEKYILYLKFRINLYTQFFPSWSKLAHGRFCRFLVDFCSDWSLFVDYVSSSQNYHFCVFALFLYHFNFE